MQDQTAEPETLATLRPSPPRRAFGIGTLALLGVLLIWMAVATPPDALGWMLVLAGAGAGALWSADRLRRATRGGLRLTREALITEDGTELFRLAEVTGVERGALAFKPSGGFLVRLSSPRPGAWAPGLWWRWRRSVGVGGVTNSAEARAMADVIAALAREEG